MMDRHVRVTRSPEEIEHLMSRILRVDPTDYNTGVYDVLQWLIGASDDIPDLDDPDTQP